MVHLAATSRPAAATCCHLAARLLTRRCCWVATNSQSLPAPLTTAKAVQLNQATSSAFSWTSTKHSSSWATEPLVTGGDPQQAGQNKTARLRVAVDIDEVLGRFLFTLNLYCQEVHGMKYELQDYWVYEYHRIWGCSPERASDIVHDFFKSEHFKKGIPIIPGAADTLTRLGASCDLFVVTSRQHAIQGATLEWIERHYPGVFQEVHFGNHFALEGAARKKSEICRSVGAQVLIDDNPGYAQECAEAGMHVLLYDWEHAYPWSKIPAGSLHPRITVVRDWAEAERTVAALALRLLPQQQQQTQQTSPSTGAAGPGQQALPHLCSCSPSSPSSPAQLRSPDGRRRGVQPPPLQPQLAAPSGSTAAASAAHPEPQPQSGAMTAFPPQGSRAPAGSRRC